MIRDSIVDRLLVVFDLDGTLVNSRRDIAVSANEALTHFGAPPLDDDAIARFVGDGARMLMARTLKAAGIDAAQLPAALATFLEIYNRRLLETTVPYDGIGALIAELAEADEWRARGVVLGVITNKPQQPSERILAAFDLARHFRWVIGGDTTWPRKPDPSSLEWMMADAGVSPAQTLFVGDTEIDARTARAARAPFCLASYGFGQERGATALLPGETAAPAAEGIRQAVARLVRPR